MGDAHVALPCRTARAEAADGTFVVGDSADGAHSANSQLFLESEVAIANVRWLSLDIARVVTRGDKWGQPDLSRVDEVGRR